MPVNPLDDLPDAQRPGFQINVLPAQAKSLPNPKPKSGCDEVQRFEAISPRCGKERLRLLRRQRYALDTNLARRIGERGGVACDNIPFDGAIERDSQDRADVRH